jgi:hypothetical protein
LFGFGVAASGKVLALRHYSALALKKVKKKPCSGKQGFCDSEKIIANGYSK